VREHSNEICPLPCTSAGGGASAKHASSAPVVSPSADSCSTFSGTMTTGSAGAAVDLRFFDSPPVFPILVSCGCRPRAGGVHPQLPWGEKSSRALWVVSHQQNSKPEFPKSLCQREGAGGERQQGVGLQPERVLWKAHSTVISSAILHGATRCDGTVGLVQYGACGRAAADVSGQRRRKIELAYRRR
jgi:hypothetical protein